MTTKKQTSRKTNSKISLSKIIFILIILAAVAAIIAYFLTQSSPHIEKDTVQPASQLKWNENKPQVITATKPMIKTKLEGSWVNNYNGIMLDVHGQQFSVDSPSVDNNFYFEGTFSIIEDLIQFTNRGKNTPCADYSGKYRFKLKEGTLIIKLENDTCTLRKSKLIGTWQRL